MKKLKKQLLSSTSHYAIARNSMYHESERARRDAYERHHHIVFERLIKAGVAFNEAMNRATQILTTPLTPREMIQ